MPRAQSPAQPRMPAKPASRPKKPQRRTAPPKRRRPNRLRSPLSLLVMEWLGVGISITLLTMAALGEAAKRFAGLTFWNHLLPFAVGVVGLIIGVAAALLFWLKIRLWLLNRMAMAPTVLAMSMALMSAWLALQPEHPAIFGNFRTLVGGKAQAERLTLAHQVYAAYRRQDLHQLGILIQRATPFNAAIADAAEAFDLDQHLLQGVAATESSFLPRDSHDGGHGLFQITAVPDAITRRACKALGKAKADLNEPRDNAYIAAATLKHYLAEMKGDLFLGLLAYNIGPKNGGLRFIMEQYGARDFVTLQPYLQQLPRDYPIRVLSHALAFKIWQHHQGQLLAYEEGRNARAIQRLDIPGMTDDF
ncbi:MAG: lytic transglycosylase domain-containing protein [Methylomonas sp.]|nr:lytic transglycosylase domain-containing protein [Methylomonas sp.]